MRTRTQLLALLAGPIGALADCTHNNCLRAVIGEAFPTRNGAADCSSYLQVTVTPPTSTFTATVTVPTEVGLSLTVTETYSSVETTVASTETISSQETSTVEVTDTETVTVATTKTIDYGAALRARQATAYGSTFPAYATVCTDFPKYSSACSCLGYYASTVTVAAPSTTLTEYVTVTSTSTSLTTTSTTTLSTESITDTTLVTSTLTLTTTDATTTTSATATSFVTNLAVNGGFEQSSLSPWHVSQGTASRVPGGSYGTSANSLRSGDLHDNNLFEIWQPLATVPGQTYTCTYDWMFSAYYATYYSNDGYGQPATFVPYVHVYIQWSKNDYLIYSNQQPDSSAAGSWQTASFTFVAQGNDELYFDCASPQSLNKPGKTAKAGQGDNYVYLDNVVCVASQ